MYVLQRLLKNPAGKFWITLFCVVVASVVLGGILTFDGIFGWDDMFRYPHSKSLFNAFFAGGANPGAYAPLWELILGLFTEVIFPFLRDPYWVRQSLNFSLFPISLFLVYVLLRRSDVEKPTAVLVVAILFGFIRFGGHAIFNTKDFPAAAAYLILSIAFWVILQEGHKRGYSFGRIVFLGCLSTIPFLLRVPLLSFVCYLIAFFLFYALFCRTQESLFKKIIFVITSICTAAIVLTLLYPPSWEHGLIDGVSKGFHTFSYYRHGGPDARVFGIPILGHMPRWFPFAWIPIIIQPLALAACAVGLLAVLFSRKKCGKEFTLSTILGTYNLSLRRWLFLILISTWAAVLIIRPRVYDEERHLLFLYPILFLFGGLGLNFLKVRWKYFLVALITVTSLFSYSNWGRFSYVYKSRIIGNIKASRFKGDAWGACMGAAVKALKGRVSSGSTIGSNLPPLSRIQKKRLHEGLFSGDPEFGNYRIVQGPAKYADAEIAFWRHTGGDVSKLLKYVEDGEAELLWRMEMPSGDPACVMISYVKEEQS